MVFRKKNSGDPGHSGLSVGLSRNKAELTLDGNSSLARGVSLLGAKVPGLWTPRLTFTAVAIDQLDKSTSQR